MKSTIGDRVREARENKEMDQATLAEKIGVVTRTLQRWEKGDQIPDGISITKIAKTTNVHPHWLLTGDGEMYPVPSRPPNIFSLPTTNRRHERLVDLPVISSVPAGKVATTGDVMVTAGELNPVLTILTERHFQIEAVHNQMLEEQPRVFFVHYWKIGTPQELADGLNATLAAVHTRKK